MQDESLHLKSPPPVEERENKTNHFGQQDDDQTSNEPPLETPSKKSLSFLFKLPSPEDQDQRNNIQQDVDQTSNELPLETSSKKSMSFLFKLPSPEDQDQRNNIQQDDDQITVESTPQIHSRSHPRYTQITPHYTPKYKSIQMSTHNKIDGETPFPKISMAKHPQEKYKTEDNSSFDQKSSLSHPTKTLFRGIRSGMSVRCFMEDSNLKKFLPRFILILILINLPIIISFAVYYFHKRLEDLASANGAISHIAFSLSADPIIDVQSATYFGRCPHSHEHLVLGTWPGTVEGCGCPHYLKKGTCSKGTRSGTEKSCTDIPPISPIDISAWVYQHSDWCVRRAKPETQYKRAAECGKGFRKCSPGICVLDTLSCPVTKVFVSGSAIWVEKMRDEPPVIGFAITNNDIPCFNADNVATGPVAPYLLIDEGNGCGEYGLDANSFALDTAQLFSVFAENHFPEKVYDLPYYDDVYIGTNAVLSYQRRLSLADKDFCLSINSEILERPVNATRYLKKFLAVTVIIALAIHGFLIFSSIMLKCLKGFFNTSWRKVMKKKWITLYNYCIFIEFIDFLVMFVATAYFGAKLIGTRNYLIQLAAEGCFLDSQTQSATNDYKNVLSRAIQNLFGYSLSVFLIGGLTALSCGYLLRRLRLQDEMRNRVTITK